MLLLSNQLHFNTRTRCKNSIPSLSIAKERTKLTMPEPSLFCMMPFLNIYKLNPIVVYLHRGSLTHPVSLEESVLSSLSIFYSRTDGVPLSLGGSHIVDRQRILGHQCGWGGSWGAHVDFAFGISKLGLLFSTHLVGPLVVVLSCGGTSLFLSYHLPRSSAIPLLS